MSFPFLDLDGNGCHDPGDSGDVSAQLLALDAPFAPAAGDLVCPARAKLLAFGSPAGSLLDWTLPGDAILDCGITLRADPAGPARLQVAAAGDVLIAGSIVGKRATTVAVSGASVTLGTKAKIVTPDTAELESAGDLIVGARAMLEATTLRLHAPTGSVHVGERVKARNKLGGGSRGTGFVEIVAGGDVAVGAKTSLQHGCCGNGFPNHFGILLDAGGTLSVGDGVKLTSTSSNAGLAGDRVVIGTALTVRVGEDLMAITGNSEVTVGPRASVMMGAFGDFRVTADPTSGAIDVGGRLTVRGSSLHGLEMSAATVALAAPSDIDGWVIIDADSAIDVDGMLVGPHVADDVTLTLGTAGTIRWLNSAARGTFTHDLTLTTAPGGVCDITGSTTGNLDIDVSGCTLVGP